MRAGKLDQRVTIQRKSVTQSDSGQPVETWAALGPLRRPASYTAVTSMIRGDERMATEQRVALGAVQFVIRYSAEVADLSPLDRIVYPALMVDNGAPAESLLFDISAINPIGRNDGLQIIAIRRADVA